MPSQNESTKNQNGGQLAVISCSDSSGIKNSQCGKCVQSNGQVCSGVDGQITIYLTKENLSVLAQPQVNKKTEVTTVNENQNKNKDQLKSSSNVVAGHTNESFVKD